ncbi:MAG: penicillin-binding transpeptidase domain-containing protein [Bdellovibrionales bacterium]
MIAAYIQISLWIGTAWILFKLVPFGRTSFHGRKIIAYSVLSVSVTLPVFVSRLPDSYFPSLATTTERVASRSWDGGDVSARPVGQTLAQLRATVSRSLGSPKPNLGLTSAGWTLGLLLGIFLMCVYRIRDRMRLKQLLGEATILHNLGRVRVAITDHFDIPFSFLTWRHAYVVLPSKLILHPRDFKVALRHEVEHHRRRDTLWVQVLEGLVCVFFFNPAIYAWRKTILELQELACDEALISRMGISVQDYGSCLLRVAEMALGKRSVYFAGTASMIPIFRSSSHSFLKRRINMFAQHERHLPRRGLAIAIGTILSLSFAVAVYAGQTLGRSKQNVNSGKPLFDTAIQQITSDVLNNGLTNLKASAGFAIISDVRRGTVIAAVSINRGFDPKLKGDWALSYPLEPGSALKPLIVASALQHKATTIDDVYDCGNGEYLFGGMLNHDVRPMGRLSTAETIMHSSNIGTIKIGERLGAEGIVRALREFGVGGETVKEFPAARGGHVPNAGVIEEEKFIALVSQGISNRTGFHVTPLELVQAYGAMANGGRLMRALSARGTHDPEMVRDVLSPEVASQMREVLRRVVQEGTARTIRDSTLELAGKTSTIIVNGNQRVGGFIGYAPAGDPKLVIYVALFDPKIPSPAGSNTAAPVFRELAEKVVPEWTRRF